MINRLPVLVALLLIVVSSKLAAQVAPPPASHDIQVTLSPASGAIEIRDRVVVTGRDRFAFPLASWIAIEQVMLDGAVITVQRENHGYVIKLPDSGRHELWFSLKGNLPARNIQPSVSARGSSGSDGTYLPAGDAWIPHDWSGLVEYRLSVNVPADQRAVAAGRLVTESTEDDSYFATFESGQAGEPPSLFAGPYQVNERRVNGLRLRTYFHADLVALSDVYLTAAADYIQRYQAVIGAYPYDDFHVISAPLPVGLGFPNLTYVGRRVIPLPFMRGRSLAHEVLHNWWGNGVAVDYADGNWAEGLTTFMADYALEQDKGEAAARGMRIKWLRDYAALPANRDQPARAFKSKYHQASQVIGYNKVAFVFHMLTLEIGQAAFDAGLRLFWERHRYGIAGWAELQAAFEQSAGTELDWFFRQWLDRRGAPRLSLGAHRVEQLEQGFRISVEILQPVSGYRFKLPVLLQTADGFERHEITVSETLTRVEWVTSAKPVSLHFDPDSDVFRLLQRNETPPILRDVTLNPKTVTMIGSSDTGFDRVARNLAARLMDVEARFETLDPRSDIDRPLLLITTSDKLAPQLAQLKLTRPAELAAPGGNAAAWTARLENGNPVLVVSADDAAALQTLLRPLPHYGGQSYVLFEAGRAAGRGIWPVTRGPLYLDLSDS